jgi:hypothetical protein
MKLEWQRGPNLAARGSIALLSLLLPFGLGCVHRMPSIQGTYRLEQNANFPLLVPSFASTIADGDFQTSRLFLAENDRRRNEGLHTRDCSVEGEVFSLHPEYPAAFWTVRSLSLQGWNHRGSEIDIDAEWKLLAEKLDTLQQNGCFAPGENAASVRQAIASVIPLPAGELQSFFYSADAEGFVDLAPGMEIKVEELQMSPPKAFQAARPEVGDQRTASGLTSSDGYFEVVSGTGGTLLRRSKSKYGRSSGGDELYPDLPNRFATTHWIRLFFESLSKDGSTRSAMLLGSSSLRDLNAATDRIRSRGKVACATHQPESICVVFVNDSVSLLVSLWINGRSMSYPLGTQLAVLLPELPESKQAKLLSSVRVMRPLASGGYAEILFPKTMDALRQVTLLPGDRVAWRQ